MFKEVPHGKEHLHMLVFDCSNDKRESDRQKKRERNFCFLRKCIGVEKGRGILFQE
jgi:hypothetical protein